MTVATMARLAADYPTIIGVKDATGAIARVSSQRHHCGPDFCQLSGNHDMALAFTAGGGRGCISVTANVAPGLSAQFPTAILEGRWADALSFQDRLRDRQSVVEGQG